MQLIREIVIQKISKNGYSQHSGADSINKCSVPGHKLELFRKAEPLIDEEEPKKTVDYIEEDRNINYICNRG